MKVEIKGYYGVKAPRKRCNISCCEKNKKQSATASFLLIIQNVQQRRSKLPDFKIDKDLSHFHQKRRLKARTQVEREGSTKGITEGRTRPARGRSTKHKPPRSSLVKPMAFIPLSILMFRGVFVCSEKTSKSTDQYQTHYYDFSYYPLLHYLLHYSMVHFLFMPVLFLRLHSFRAIVIWRETSASLLMTTVCDRFLIISWYT